jgi:hypothetical protein
LLPVSILNSVAWQVRLRVDIMSTGICSSVVGFPIKREDAYQVIMMIIFLARRRRLARRRNRRLRFDFQLFF